MTLKRFLGITLLCLSLLAGPALANEKITVAVSMNFVNAFQEIARSFKAKTGISVEATYSSTGQIYAQIISGAPYDLFLSADQEKPELLHRAGWADIPFVYATGQVVLWTTRHDLCSAGNWREALSKTGLKKIAVANPKTAPYGAAATDALRKAGILEHVQGKLVYAQTIAQAFQYAATGSVDAGFCALSSTLSEEGRKGCFFSVDEAPPIVQSACLLKAKLNGSQSKINVYKRTGHRETAENFVRFLDSPEAVTIKKKYGYR